MQNTSCGLNISLVRKSAKRLFCNDFSEPDDSIQWSPEFVAHRRQKGRLCRVRGLGFVACDFERSLDAFAVGDVLEGALNDAFAILLVARLRPQTDVSGLAARQNDLVIELDNLP